MTKISSWLLRPISKKRFIQDESVFFQEDFFLRTMSNRCIGFDGIAFTMSRDLSFVRDIEPIGAQFGDALDGSFVGNISASARSGALTSLNVVRPRLSPSFLTWMPATLHLWQPSVPL